LIKITIFYFLDRIKKHDKHEVTRSQESAELPEVPRLLPIPKQENKQDWLSEVPETRTSDVQLSFNDDEKGTLLILHNYIHVIEGGVRVMVFNTTFNNISVISWQSVLLKEETGVSGENHR